MIYLNDSDMIRTCDVLLISGLAVGLVLSVRVFHFTVQFHVIIQLISPIAGVAADISYCWCYS